MACGGERLQELTLAIDGVTGAQWDGQNLSVQFDAAKTSAIDIQLELSFKGYDAGDFGYTPDPNLPECCRKQAAPVVKSTSMQVPPAGKVVVSEIKEEKPTTPQPVFEAPKQGPAPKTTPASVPAQPKVVTRGEDLEEDEELEEEVNVLMEAEDEAEWEDNEPDLLLEEEEAISEEEGSDLWADDVSDEWGGWYDADEKGKLEKEEEDVLIEEDEHSSVSSGPADLITPEKKETKPSPADLERMKREERLKAAKEAIEKNNKPK